MRNLKRALSLALASVMLLGMMVVGSSAASADSFTDADKIVNKEAVAIATGLGIFDGYTDGSFGPDKVVTRAEMAVIITKILHGADIDPAIFSGDSKFADVPAWAEGYVNLCDSLNIVEGYNETTFGTNDPVTTVQASTMLLKALGYYTSEGDALSPTDWKLEATSKATALGFYGDLSLKMDDGLTRENVAELVFNALFAQRVAFDDVRGLHVKASDRNVVVTNGTDDEMNTLAQNTFGLYAVTGLVTANGMTDMQLEGKTLVEFDDDKDVTGDNKIESSYKFAYETDLDMIGHAATVYYKIIKKAPSVYAIVDNATLAVETVLTDNLSTLAKAEGFAKDTSDTAFAYNYDLESTVVTDANYAGKDGQIVKLISNSSDLTVDYAIVIESTLDYVDDILVNDADKDDPILSYELLHNNIIRDDANAIAVGEVEEADYVLVTAIANRDTTGTSPLYLIEAADTEIETIVKVTRKLATTTKLSSEAVDYVESDIAIENKIEADHGSCIAEETVAVIPYAAVLMEGDYVLIYDTAERLIGVVPVEVDTVINAAYVAQFGVKINTDPTLFDDYALYAHVYFADGTNGVYTVDTSDDFVGNAFYGTAKVTGGTTKFEFKDTVNLAVTSIGDKNVTKDYEKTNPGATYNADMNDTDGEGYGEFVRLYDVKVQDNGKVRIKELPNQGVKTDATNGYTPSNDNMSTSSWSVAYCLNQLKKGVTWMGDTSATYATDSFYGNSNTTFFFVDGVYNKGGDKLKVSTITGMANVPTVDLDDAFGTRSDYNADNTTEADDNAKIYQATAIQKTGYMAVEYAMVNGYKFAEAIDGVYYYDEVYTVVDTKDGYFDLIFTVYDAETGEETTITYADYYKTDVDARNAAKDLRNGYYTEGTVNSHTLAYFKAADTSAVVDGDAPANAADLDHDDIMKVDTANNTYVIDTKFDMFIDQGDTLTMYTSANADRAGVTVNKDTVLVDLVTKDGSLSGLAIDKLDAMNRLIEARNTIWDTNDVSYTKYTETATLVYDYDKHNQVGVIYIVDMLPEYDKDYTPEISTNVDVDLGTFDAVSAVNGTTGIDVTFTDAVLAGAASNVKVEYTLATTDIMGNTTVKYYSTNNGTVTFNATTHDATLTIPSVFMNALKSYELHAVMTFEVGSTSYVIEGDFAI